MYQTKEGKVLHVYVISNDRWEQMDNSGYAYKISTIEGTPLYQMSEQQIYDYFTSLGYEKVRIYEETTRIRGYHHLYAMVK